MKKTLMVISLVVLFCLTFGCQKQVQVERFMEDGVEVVVNHVEPYKLRGEPSNLILEKVLSIDTERDDIVEIGLTDIGAFDVDSEGNIYIVSPEAKENFIFKFDREGNYVNSFFRRRQGFGEIQKPRTLKITSQDEITITNIMKHTLLVFNNSGNLIDETPITIETLLINEVIPLKNGNYFCMRIIVDPSASADYSFHFILGLHDSDFKNINDLDEYKLPDFLKGKKALQKIRYLLEMIIGVMKFGYLIWMEICKEK